MLCYVIYDVPFRENAKHPGAEKYISVFYVTALACWHFCVTWKNKMIIYSPLTPKTLSDI